MGSAGPAETFFVVASTDMQRSGIMTTRIREQLERIADLKNKTTLTIITKPVEFLRAPGGTNLEAQVEHVANRVTEMVKKTLGKEKEPSFAAKAH